jgi:ubiquinone/menaquinone biosynthesis C-methylase UbiE
MKPRDTDYHWELFGKKDPYFGVYSDEIFKSGCINEAALEKFFSSGQIHADLIMQKIHDHVDPDFQPESCLEYGCGVGRLVIPFSKICKHVIGTDVSTGMLQITRKNCDERGIMNVDLVAATDSLVNVRNRKFDLIYSIHVFQHIPYHRGKVIFSNLMDRLADGGIGAIHFYYMTTPFLKFRNIAYKNIPLLNNLINIIKRREYNYPYMQMNPYNLNEIMDMVQSRGFVDVHLYLPTEIKNWGALLLFQKKPS